MRRTAQFYRSLPPGRSTFTRKCINAQRWSLHISTLYATLDTMDTATSYRSTGTEPRHSTFSTLYATLDTMVLLQATASQAPNQAELASSNKKTLESCLWKLLWHDTIREPWQIPADPKIITGKDYAFRKAEVASTTATHGWLPPNSTVRPFKITSKQAKALTQDPGTSLILTQKLSKLLGDALLSQR